MVAGFVQTLTGSRALQAWAPVSSLGAGASATALLGVDFADSIHPIDFSIACSAGKYARKNFVALH
jgi:hypothetical protein